LDGRGAPPAEKGAQRDDQTGSTASQQEPIIHQIFDKCAAEVQGLIRPLPTPELPQLHRISSDFTHDAEARSSKLCLASFDQLNRWERVDSGDGLLVDDLRLTISREENAEAVEGGHVALELDPVLEETSSRNLMVLKVPEKHLLNRLVSALLHVEVPSLVPFHCGNLGHVL
jgi:hypothetical protein